MLKIFDWILGKGEQEEAFEVEFSNLSEWLWKYAEDEINQDITEYGLLLKELKEKAKELDKLDVEDEKIEVKLKELVRGNKPAYTNSLRILMSNMETPRSISYKTLNEFCDRVDLFLNEFSKRTIRNYAILKTIIGKELADIVDILKQLESIELKVKKDYLLSSRMKTIEDIRGRLAFFYDLELSKGKRDHELMQLNKKRELIVQELKTIKDRLDKLKINDDFYEYERLNIRISDLASQEIKLKSTLSTLFSEISRPLRKLDKVSKLVTKYSDDPYNALKDDHNLEILGLITDLRNMVDSGKIDVKNKKKTIGEIDAALANLNEHQKTILEIPKELKTLQSKLASNQFEKLEKELTSRFQQLENELSDIMTEIGSLEEHKKELNLVQITKDIEKLVGRKVTVRNAPVM